MAKLFFHKVGKYAWIIVMAAAMGLLSWPVILFF
jgi:hypothetical protein